MPKAESFADKIASVKAVEKDFPGAVIIHRIKDTTVVYMNPWGLQYLNTTLEKLQQQGTEYHNIYFNPEDNKDYGPKIFSLLEHNNDDEFSSYFQQIRQSVHSDWVWFLASTKIFMRNEHGEPAYILTTSIPVDAKHHLTNKVQRLLDENNFLRRQQPVFNTLTKREKEILRTIAIGRSSVEIAKELHISEETVKTHRRNLKFKLDAATNYDIVRFAQAFDLI